MTLISPVWVNFMIGSSNSGARHLFIAVMVILMTHCSSGVVRKIHPISVSESAGSISPLEEIRIDILAPQLEKCAFPRDLSVYEENRQRLKDFLTEAINADRRAQKHSGLRISVTYDFSSYFGGIPLRCADNSYWYSLFSLGLIPGWSESRLTMQISNAQRTVTVKAEKSNRFHLIFHRHLYLELVSGAIQDWPAPINKHDCVDPIHLELLTQMLDMAIEGLNSTMPQ